MAKKQQRFTQKPTVFEQTQEDVDRVIRDLLAAEAEAVARARAEAEAAEDDSEYDWAPWEPTEDELANDTAPLQSERAAVVEDAAREDDLRAGMAAIDAWIEAVRADEGQEQATDGLAWWWDVPIPFSITPRGRSELTDRYAFDEPICSMCGKPCNRPAGMCVSCEQVWNS